MNDNFEHMAKACDKVLYFLSGSMTLGGFLDVLDRHQWIVGAIIGLLTLAANCYFKQKHLDWVMSQKP